MSEGVLLDALIRQAMHEAVVDAEPSAAIRDSLLVEATRSASRRSALGPAMPALVDGLCEKNEDDCRLAINTPDVAATRGQWLMLVAPIYAVR